MLNHFQVMTTQYQQTNDMQPHVVDQSQQTQTIQLIGAGKKKEKILLPCSHCKDSFRTECQLQVPELFNFLFERS